MSVCLICVCACTCVADGKFRVVVSEPGLGPCPGLRTAEVT